MREREREGGREGGREGRERERENAWRMKAAKELSSTNKKDQTCYTQCWKHDRKKWRSCTSHGKEEPASASAMCTRDQMERE